MPESQRMTDDDVRTWIRAEGLATLVPTASLPSLFTRVTGQSAVSNWWSHPRGGEVFNAGELLADDPDVRVVRIAAGKVTFLHRDLWPALLGVVCDEGFVASKTAGLADTDKQVLAVVRAQHRIRMDVLAGLHGMPDRKRLGRARKKLLDRLLLYDEQEHTESGKHELVLMTWDNAPFDGVEPLAYDAACAALREALRDARSALPEAR